MTDHSALIAALADHYVINREVGSGGMATVFLARDLRHDRPVAVKVLKPELGAVLGAERFLAEIRVTANLQHPNLLPLFDSGEAAGHLFYVMPFVEGETLRARLDREKQLPVDEAVRLATGIAQALDYAHARGVIHRDLKPENVLLQAGQPVVADFGIALAVSQAGGQRVTQTGLSLGTPQYMSPEQATGDRDIDARSDLFSLAALTYEMLTGEAPHAAPTTQAVIARLLTEHPRPVRALRATVPPHVDDALTCALEKLPADRFASVAEFRDALTGARPVARRAEAITAPTRAPRHLLALVAVGGVLGGGLIGAWMMRGRDGGQTSTGAPTIRAVIAGVTPGFQSSMPSISADGTVIASVRMGTEGDSTSRVVLVRRIDEPDPRPLAGTEGAMWAAISPDGAHILFGTSQGILLIAATGGPVSTVVPPVGRLSDVGWAADGQVMYIGQDTLWVAPMNGGSPTVVFARGPANDRMTGAQLLRDGKAVLYFTQSRVDAGRNVFFHDLKSGRTSRLLENVSGEAYVLSGYLIYSRADGTVYAAEFDMARGQLTGPEVAVLSGVEVNQMANALFSASKGGTVLYQRRLRSNRLYTVGPDRQRKPFVFDGDGIRGVALSPDGQRLAIGVLRPAPNIYIHDLSVGSTTRVGTAKSKWDPVWSPRGDSLAYHGGAYSRVSFGGFVSAIADTVERPLFVAPKIVAPQAWLPDGRLVVRGPKKAGEDLWVVSPASDGGQPLTSTLLLDADWDESHAVVSPDSRWLAYQASEDGVPKVYVRDLSDVRRGKWVISEGEGRDPLWARDGSALTYWSGKNLTRARVRTTPNFAVTERSVIMEDDRYAPSCCMRNYAFLSDGTLLLARSEVPELPQLELIVNWFTDVRARVAAAKKAR